MLVNFWHIVLCSILIKKTLFQLVWGQTIDWLYFSLYLQKSVTNHLSGVIGQSACHQTKKDSVFIMSQRTIVVSSSATPAVYSDLRCQQLIWMYSVSICNLLCLIHWFLASTESTVLIRISDLGKKNVCKEENCIYYLASCYCLMVQMMHLHNESTK